MHTCTLDLVIVLKDRLSPPDQPIAQQGIHTRGYSEAREGGAQLHGGLQSFNRIITPASTTTIRIVGGAMCIDNASNTTLIALSRIFHLIKMVNL
jgi:hypothetical protein